MTEDLKAELSGESSYDASVTRSSVETNLRLSSNAVCPSRARYVHLIFPVSTDHTDSTTSKFIIVRLLALVAERRNGPRWVVALALGLRQGETLGLKWEHVDLDTGLIRIRRNRLRPKYEHGCGGKCGRKAGYCPDRKQVRADTGPTKSRAGRRVVGLPEPLIVLLRVHREHQQAERETARQLWHDEGWVFAKPDGRPLNPNTDYHEWKAVIEEAGLPERRLHDARHTAATVLAILAVPTPTAMAIMGWSSAEMAARYQHVLDSIRKGVADQVGGLLWDAPGREPIEDHEGGDGSEGAPTLT
jgi:integrase